jgi:hypothetical protein
MRLKTKKYLLHQHQHSKYERKRDISRIFCTQGGSNRLVHCYLQLPVVHIVRFYCLLKYLTTSHPPYNPTFFPIFILGTFSFPSCEKIEKNTQFLRKFSPFSLHRRVLFRLSFPLIQVCSVTYLDLCPRRSSVLIATTQNDA